MIRYDMRQFNVHLTRSSAIRRETAHLTSLYIVRCKRHFDTLNRLGVEQIDRQTDGWADRQTKAYFDQIESAD